MKIEKRNLDAILLLDKPTGLTSNRALQQIKRLFQAKKAGHTGSLDPLATGLLPICFGQATKFSQHLLLEDKIYQVVMKLGERTTTSDAEGEIIATAEVPVLSIADIQALFESFIGKISQIPSMYSALKYQGKPLYSYARAGQIVPRKSRQIHIYDIQVQALAKENQVEFRVHCSTGTYVRTLVDDFGQKLGVGAHVTGLRRLQVGSFLENQMVSQERLEQAAEQGLSELDTFLLPVETALSKYPEYIVSDEAAQKLSYGQEVLVSEQALGLMKLMTKKQGFLGIGEVTADSRLVSRRLMHRRENNDNHEF